MKFLDVTLEIGRCLIPINKIKLIFIIYDNEDNHIKIETDNGTFFINFGKNVKESEDTFERIKKNIEV